MTMTGVIPVSKYKSDQAPHEVVKSGVLHAEGHPHKRDLHLLFTNYDVVLNVAYPSLASYGYTVSFTNFCQFSQWSQLNPSVTLTPSRSGGFYRVDAKRSGSRYPFACTPVHIRRHVQSAGAPPDHIAPQKGSAMARAPLTERGAATWGRDNQPSCANGGEAARGRTVHALPPSAAALTFPMDLSRLNPIQKRAVMDCIQDDARYWDSWWRYEDCYPAGPGPYTYPHGCGKRAYWTLNDGVWSVASEYQPSSLPTVSRRQRRRQAAWRPLGFTRILSSNSKNESSVPSTGPSSVSATSPPSSSCIDTPITNVPGDTELKKRSVSIALTLRARIDSSNFKGANYFCGTRVFPSLDWLKTDGCGRRAIWRLSDDGVWSVMSEYPPSTLPTVSRRQMQRQAAWLPWGARNLCKSRGFWERKRNWKRQKSDLRRRAKVLAHPSPVVVSDAPLVASDLIQDDACFLDS